MVLERLAALLDALDPALSVLIGKGGVVVSLRREEVRLDIQAEFSTALSTDAIWRSMRPTVAFTTFSTVLRASFSIIFDVLNATKAAMARKIVAVTATTAKLMRSAERIFDCIELVFISTPLRKRYIPACRPQGRNLPLCHPPSLPRS